MALTRAAPARVGHEALLDMWRLAAQGKSAVRNTAVASVLSLLACDPPPGASAPANASHAGVLSAAAEDAGWTTLQRLATWWLGEHANGAAGEWAGQTQPAPAAADDATDAHHKGNGLPDEAAAVAGVEAGAGAAKQLTRAELAVREAARSPLMLTVLQALQRALSTGSWHVRVAAVESIGKVGMRSRREEAWLPRCARVPAHTTLHTRCVLHIAHFRMSCIDTKTLHHPHRSQCARQSRFASTATPC